MNIKELIEKLKDMPEDAEVFIEGCDCVGRAEDVSLNSEESEPWILIER